MTFVALTDHSLRRTPDSNRLTVVRLFLLVLIALIMAACGNGAANPDADEPVVLRPPKPTFTPTVMTAPIVGPTPLTNAPAAGTGGSIATPVPQPVAAPQVADPAKAVVNAPLVNVRRGPGTDYDIVVDVERGAEFDITGKNADASWWQICCVEGGNAWIIAEYVDTIGNVDTVPVVDPNNPNPPAQADVAEQPAPAAAPTAIPTPTSPPVPQTTFDLVAQEQFPETGLVRIFLYVYAGNDALEGYSLRVTKDGQELPVTGQSFAGQPAFTWPFQDARQRYQNFKIEYTDVPAAGEWVVQLVDAAGNTVGPAATFTLADNDPQQELYVRYQQR